MRTMVGAVLLTITCLGVGVMLLLRYAINCQVSKLANLKCWSCNNLFDFKEEKIY